ncbi:MAG TPA: hypothetical protein VEF72_21295 [Mycobacterium sp.]|nr:hypothetical protein [Mycobacterium sp.]
MADVTTATGGPLIGKKPRSACPMTVLASSPRMAIAMASADSTRSARMCSSMA